MKSSCFEFFRDQKYGLFLSQKVDGKMIFTWSFLVFYDIPGLGQYGFLCSVTLSANDNSKVLQELKSCFKRTINWKISIKSFNRKTINQYLGYLIDSSFQGINRPFVLSFKNYVNRTEHTGCFRPTVKIKD